MISGVMLASYGFGSGAIGDVLAQWEQAGFFSYLLPFLLIFAVIFGILTKIKLFEENKAINAIISLSIGFMSLQLPLVSQFFSEIFPRVGIGLIVILAIIILAGLFVDPKSNFITYGLLTIGIVVAIIVLSESADVFGMSIPSYIKDNIPQTVMIIGVLLIIGALVKGSEGAKPKDDYRSIWPSIAFEKK
jgi:hypothetical protein